MRASQMNGLDISIKIEDSTVVAAVSLYPHRIDVKVPRSTPYDELFDKIKVAFLELYANKDVQY